MMTSDVRLTASMADKVVVGSPPTGETTGTPVCGGLSSHQAMSILRGLEGINVVGMDIVEVAPAYDVGEITSLAAAHLAMEMLYLYACRPGA